MMLVLLNVFTFVQLCTCYIESSLYSLVGTTRQNFGAQYVYSTFLKAFLFGLQLSVSSLTCNDETVIFSCDGGDAMKNSPLEKVLGTK